MEKNTKIKGITLIKLIMIITLILVLLAIGIVVMLKKDKNTNQEIETVSYEKSIETTDSNRNQWVWVKVPRSIYINATNSADIVNIEKDMKEYVGEYGKKLDGDEKTNYYTDEWMPKSGLVETEYIENKNKMLTSIYEKEGFWISKYEIGRETKRKDKEESIEGEENKPLSQKDKYVYNKVTLPQAQTLARQMTTSTDQTSSLLYGIQWSLTLKYIEENSHLAKKDLISDSSSWGNYNAKQLEKTGMVDRNSVLGIYDLAGNEWEWTLEKRAVKMSPYTNKIEFQMSLMRGGNYMENGELFNDYGEGPSSTADGRLVGRETNTAGFRVTLY